MNLMLRLEGASPVEEVAICTYYCMIYCSYFSSLSMKSDVSSRITVTKEPVTD